MTGSEKLITGYTVKLAEDHHSPASGRYSGLVILNDDISPVFPYLNARLTEKLFDRQNSILIGTINGRRYAFRPHEIQAGIVSDACEAAPLAENAVELVNRVWREERHHPRLQRAGPAAGIRSVQTSPRYQLQRVRLPDLPGMRCRYAQPNSIRRVLPCPRQARICGEPAEAAGFMW